ncbi:MAG: hypothetical protein QOI98_515 [Solirubrobacteraceae bacterium]|nr:hypothetical protein [Solirubrobacteraceae bacterium]
MTLRRVGAWTLALAFGVGVVAVLLVVLGSRDKSTFQDTSGPGQVFRDQGARHLQAGTPHAGFAYNSDPPTSGPHAVSAVTRDDTRLDTDRLLTALELGNVVLVYSDSALRGDLRALQRDVAGPFDPVVASAGQAIVLARGHPVASSRITALAWRHRLLAGSPRDPALRDFVEFWLGRGAPRP